MSTGTQPPESELIERLRKDATPKLSMREAARRAGISDGRWRQIIKGFKQETADVRVPVKGPADTIARMAQVVGATVDQLRDAGRDDAAAELDRLLNAPESDTLRLLRVRATPEAERTPDDVAFLKEWDAAHPRRPDPNLGVDDDGNWLPVEATFENWLRARNQLNTRVLHYARARGISFNDAEEELPHVQQMATDVANGSGRPWTPPWDPGAEFEEGEEPWKADFWTYTEAVPSPFGTEGHIYQHGTTYDLAEARRRRDLTAHAEEVWEADVRRQTAAYQERQRAAVDNDNAALTPNEAARSAVPGLQLSEVNEHSVKTVTALPDDVYTAGFNTASEEASPVERGFFVATGGSSASAIPGLHVAWPKIDVVFDLPELPDREPVTEGLAPKIDSDVLEGWSAAMDDLHEKFSALQSISASDPERDTATDLAVRAFLTAMDIYVFSTRDLVRAMQAVDLYASESQIQTGLGTFEYNIELAELYLPVVEGIEQAAPNKRLKVLPSRSAEGLRALISSLKAAHDAWIDTGLSSEHPAAAMRALAAAARTAPPGYVGPSQAVRDAQDRAGEEGQDRE